MHTKEQEEEQEKAIENLLDNDLKTYDDVTKFLEKIIIKLTEDLSENG